MKDVMTFDEAHYFDIGTAQTPNVVLGGVITQLDENSNPTESEKQYIHQKSATTLCFRLRAKKRCIFTRMEDWEHTHRFPRFVPLRIAEAALPCKRMFSSATTLRPKTPIAFTKLTAWIQAERNARKKYKNLQADKPIC